MKVIRIVEKKTKKISFGKVAFPPYQKKRACKVELELGLTTMSDGSVRFSVCGSIWNHLHTDIYSGGQNDETIRALIKEGELSASPLLLEILELWDKYHLNDLKPGTPEQEEAVQQGWELGAIKRFQKESFYEQACAYLKSVGLYEVQYNGKPYRYGSAWIYSSIPPKDLKRIKEIMEG
ncbi:hypothetical protein [Helicobacter labetoulli]|uniref:hypothetical protein n=1 Tax=Helicobacter labetoulli TaxID=2315333 RepID=UPI000EF69897|nr:hypothetical protein [Helicobacter labetoulli]